MFKSPILRNKISYLTKHLTPKNGNKVAEGTSKGSNKQPPRNQEKFVITPAKLTDYYRIEDFPQPTPKFRELAANFFLHAKTQLQWTLASYEEIPDVKDELLRQKDPQYQPKFKSPILPEILMLGYTNAGKSTLINTLLNGMKPKDKSKEYAYSSSRAGFTKTMNSFNISNKFVLMDCPGYGKFGDEKQGEMVLTYISNRKQLRSAIMIIDSTNGFREEDILIINHLVDNGIPFDIVFSKVDVIIERIMKAHKVQTKNIEDVSQRLKNMNEIEAANSKIIQYFHTMIEDVGLSGMAVRPKLLFYNSQINSKTNKKSGFEEIRTTIIERCDLEESLKRLRSKK
ncbi:MIOREX complex component 8 [[Candida] jaroonii]|uniref:MIOREX complex component 8 n=1 Tax=[Candida] jaroonii TaxID=467808 RepID=A0ACA9Y2Q8_9ASCO|nr:MIOREX complex component 8 [[Candida] jaroonii]